MPNINWKTFVPTIFKDTRSGFGQALWELGQKNEAVVGLCADLTDSLKMGNFAKDFPHRFFNVGIAEANMIGIAAGLALGGKIPFACSFANFATGRVYDQIRQSVAYSNTNVKICASHAGLTLGEDGATHQILEDLGLMKMLPNLTVINPCDYAQTRLATLEIAEHLGPVYLRFGRPVVPVVTENFGFEIGKGIVLQEGSQVSLLATGHLVQVAIDALKDPRLADVSIELINIHTIKPLDETLILQSLAKTKCAVVAEEHQYNGGLADSVAQLLARKQPAPIEYVGVNDHFGESGKPEELMEKYGLSVDNIVEKILVVLKRK